MIFQVKSVKHNLGNNHFNYDFTTDSSITGIFGPSGAGKTTLFNLIAGVDNPSSGEISFNNTTLVDIKNNINIKGKNRNIGYVFQEHYLFPHLSIKKNLNYSKPYIKKRKHFISFNDVIKLLDLNPLLNKKPGQLSGGERQRVAMGRALLSQPQILLLDEPFSNVDCSKRKQIISYLLRINNHFKIPMLIISHHLEDILKLTRKIVLIENGDTVACDDVFNIIKSGDNPELIKPKKFQNTFKVDLREFNKLENSYILRSKTDIELTISTHSKLLNKSIEPGTKIQLSLRPIDISLSLDKLENTSVQNQLKGIIKQIIKNKEGIYCVVDCGFEVFVEISNAIISKLYLHEGQTVFCQIKASDFDVVHVYQKNQLTFKHNEQSSMQTKKNNLLTSTL